jgi:hypothetical protein
VGDDGESPVEGGARVSEGRTNVEEGASSVDDAQPARTKQAAAMAAARLANESGFMGISLESAPGGSNGSRKPAPSRSTISQEILRAPFKRNFFFE